mgnify:FL=1|nr:MAG TPA: regulatory protein [Caudoviricetes sp.]
MNQIEQTLDSREVAEMVGKRHDHLIRDIKKYIGEMSAPNFGEGAEAKNHSGSELGELKIEPTDFFRENTYRDKNKQERPCYDITKKGCEFIAHKLTGIKGTEFTACYINRFHDMEDIIHNGIERKEVKTTRKHTESLSAVNNAVKILTPMLAAAGCDSKIQLLTAKSLYEKADVTLPIMIEADQQYFDTVHIARQVGIYYQSSGKPADKAVNEIIRRLDIPQSMYTETWESKGKWQGTVRKYAPEVITMVRSWYAENGYPRDIEYVQSDGQKKTYHVIWRESEVA